MLEELGALFKGDPTFEYMFNKLPRGYFVKIVELRRKRIEKEGPQLFL
nr:MAG TPA: bacteriocin [Caudoviricetes sp.]